MFFWQLPATFHSCFIIYCKDLDIQCIVYLEISLAESNHSVTFHFVFERLYSLCFFFFIISKSFLSGPSSWFACGDERFHTKANPSSSQVNRNLHDYKVYLLTLRLFLWAASGKLGMESWLMREKDDRSKATSMLSPSK